MAGPARFTPTGLQPGSAETFATFVQGTPSAKTPFTGSELVPLIQNGFPVHAPPGVFGTTPLIRTILTATTNFYLSTTGNDSNNGLSPATAWATLAHAVAVLAESYDIGGHNVIINIGAGTFAGAGTIQCFTGGGEVAFVGAGSTSTFINCATSPTGDGFDFGSQTCAFGWNKLTFLPSNFDCIGAFAGGVILRLYDGTGTSGATDLVFRPGNSLAIVMDAQSIMFAGNAGGTITLDGTGQTSPSGFEFSFQSCFQDLGQAWAFTNSFQCGSLANAQPPTLGAGGLFTADFGGVVVTFGPTFSGTATGQLYTGFLGGGIEHNSAITAPAGMTVTGVDGSSHGSIDGLSGFTGNNLIAGAPTTSGLDTNTEGVFKDTGQAPATKGMVLYGNDAGTIFPLTPLRTTFANLPASPHQGDMASITDGLAANCADGSCTTFGTNVTGGTGALNLLIWYNGTHWTLMGK